MRTRMAHVLWIASALAVSTATAAQLQIYPKVEERPAVEVTDPESGETHHDNRGRLPVAVSADMPYAAIRVLLDGEPHGELRASPSFVLEKVQRGEHTLQVELLDRHGAVVASSEPVVFYMWQASRLFPSRTH